MKTSSTFTVGIFLLGTTFGMMPPSADVEFELLAKQYVDEFPALSPVLATLLGDHRFDDELDQITEEPNQNDQESEKNQMFPHQTAAD